MDHDRRAGLVKFYLAAFQNMQSTI